MGGLKARNRNKDARKGDKTETNDKVTHGTSAQMKEGIGLPCRSAVANRGDRTMGGLSSRPGLVENAPDEAILAQLG
jgi:hypothetical protein